MKHTDVFQAIILKSQSKETQIRVM